MLRIKGGKKEELDDGRGNNRDTKEEREVPRANSMDERSRSAAAAAPSTLLLDCCTLPIILL
jgi:hypothetical protein